MAARAAVASLLSSDAALLALSNGELRVYAPNTADTPSDIQEQLFAVIRFGARTRAAGGAGGWYDLSVWWHQPRAFTRDYGVIDEAILRTKEILDAAEQVPGADGWILTAASWWGDSEEITDDGFETLTRYGSYRAACRPVVTP